MESNPSLTEIKVLGINSSDIYSSRFNGLSISSKLKEEKINYELLSDVHLRIDGKSMTPKIFKKLQVLITQIEKKTGFQSRLFFWTFTLKFTKKFRGANLIHYHILHNSFFRLESLKFLTRNKPSIWTIHDLWITTGHCIQPLECNRYLHGCGACPNLKRSISVDRDRTAAEYSRKYKLLGRLNLQYVVSTEWMKTRILASTPISEENLHVIPFGVNTEIFCPISQSLKKQYRRDAGISAEAYVVFINAHNDEIKGIEIVKKLIENWDDPRVEFLVLDSSRNFITDKKVHSFPRINSEPYLVKLLQTCDLVLIPSLGESFSMLTIEAMSCGLPVITLKGSAAHEVSGNPTQQTFSAHSAVLDIIRIITWNKVNLEKSRQQGIENRKRVLTNYSLSLYTERLKSLYVSVLQD